MREQRKLSQSTVSMFDLQSMVAEQTAKRQRFSFNKYTILRDEMKEQLEETRENSSLIA